MLWFSRGKIFLLAKIFMYSIFWFLFTSKLTDYEFCPFFLSFIYQILYDPSQGHPCNHHRDHVKPLDPSFLLHIENIEDTYQIFGFPEKFKTDVFLLRIKKETVFNHNQKTICNCFREFNKTQFTAILFLLHPNYLIINGISRLLPSLPS